jgi:hypothetical protein
VQRFSELVPIELSWATGRITLGMIEKYIGIVRGKPLPKKGEYGRASEPSKRFDPIRDAGKSG